jgi:hypothetical protein
VPGDAWWELQANHNLCCCAEAQPNQVSKDSQKSHFVIDVPMLLHLRFSHCRFFPKDSADANATRSGNVVPGLVVDTSITSPILFDFYLTPHEGIQVKLLALYLLLDTITPTFQKKKKKKKKKKKMKRREKKKWNF